MKIHLQNVGKRYKFEWIFKDLNYTFQSGNKYAILGNNGSGKSTLMKILSGHLTPSKGKVQHFLEKENQIESQQLYSQITFAAPYIEVIEEFSLVESLKFHSKFKKFVNELSIDDLIQIIGLPKSATRKEIRYFSSGMKQRVKLALAILSQSSLILLDEPTTNLDNSTVDWYNHLIEKYAFNKSIVVASNDKKDYQFCTNYINIMDFKK